MANEPFPRFMSSFNSLGGPTDAASKILGLKLPKVKKLTPDQQSKLDADIKAKDERIRWIEDAERNTGPLLGQYAKKGVHNTASFLGGVTGLGAPQNNVKNANQSDWSSFAGEIAGSGLPLGAAAKTGAGAALTLAGMPFAYYKKNKKLIEGAQHLSHGSGAGRIIDKLDPSRLDLNDVLGYLFHAAEAPPYSGLYATGRAKPSKVGNNPATRAILPFDLEAQNVLDLVDPNPDDIATAIQGMNKSGTRKGNRNEVIKHWKDAVRAKRVDPNTAVDSMKIDPRHHYEETLSPEGVPLKTNETEMFKNLPSIMAAEKMRFGADEFKQMPFDAIRYNDMQHKSFAWPADTPVKSPLGHDYTPDPPPLDPKNIRFFGGTSGDEMLDIKSTKDYSDLVEPQPIQGKIGTAENLIPLEKGATTPGLQKAQNSPAGIKAQQQFDEGLIDMDEYLSQIDEIEAQQNFGTPPAKFKYAEPPSPSLEKKFNAMKDLDFEKFNKHAKAFLDSGSISPKEFKQLTEMHVDYSLPTASSSANLPESPIPEKKPSWLNKFGDKQLDKYDAVKNAYTKENLNSAWSVAKNSPDGKAAAAKYGVGTKEYLEEIGDLEDVILAKYDAIPSTAYKGTQAESSLASVYPEMLEDEFQMLKKLTPAQSNKYLSALQSDNKINSGDLNKLSDRLDRFYETGSEYPLPELAKAKPKWQASSSNADFLSGAARDEYLGLQFLDPIQPNINFHPEAKSKEWISPSEQEVARWKRKSDLSKKTGSDWESSLKSDEAKKYAETMFAPDAKPHEVDNYLAEQVNEGFINQKDATMIQKYWNEPKSISEFKATYSGGQGIPEGSLKSEVEKMHEQGKITYNTYKEWMEKYHPKQIKSSDSMWAAKKKAEKAGKSGDDFGTWEDDTPSWNKPGSVAGTTPMPTEPPKKFESEWSKSSKATPDYTSHTPIHADPDKKYVWDIDKEAWTETSKFGKGQHPNLMMKLKAKQKELDAKKHHIDMDFETGTPLNIEDASNYYPEFLEGPSNPGLGVNNASGDSAASIEALERMKAMAAKGESFVVKKGGVTKTIIGPEAVDYVPQPGEVYGILDKSGNFTKLQSGGSIAGSKLKGNPNIGPFKTETIKSKQKSKGIDW